MIAQEQAQDTFGGVALDSTEVASPAEPAVGQMRRKLVTLGSGALVALIAFLACWFQNNPLVVSPTVFAYDGWHYQETVQLLVANVLEFTHRLPAGAGAQHGLRLPQLFINIFLDGPLLPLLGSVPWLLEGRLPGSTDGNVFLRVESLCHVCSSLMVYLLALRLLPSRRFLALGAGLVWALYPSAVIGAGTFMSEVPTTAVLLVVLYALCREREGKKFAQRALWCSIAGLLSGLLFVSKPALALALGGVFVLWFSGTRDSLDRKHASTVPSAIGSLVPLLLGLSAILIAWGAYTYSQTGHVSLAASRVPTFNVVKGSEPTADGWGTAPLTPTALRYSSEQLPVSTALVEIWRQNPKACLNLILRKCERLWGLPWNDYHYQYFGLSLGWQVWWHRMLLLSAVMGVTVFLSRFTQFSNSTRFVGAASLVVIAAHAVYLPFETMSRYGFSSMPFICLFAVVALSVLTTRATILSAGLVVLVANLFLVFVGQQCFSLCSQLARGGAAAYWIAWCLSNVVLVGLAFAILGFARLVTKVSQADLPKSLAEKSAGRSVALFAAVERYAPAAFIWMLVSIISVAGIAHILNDSEIREWATTLKSGESVTRMVALPAATALGASRNVAPDWAVLLVDGDSASESANIFVNGKRLEDHLESAYLFDTDRSDMLVRLQLHARLCRQPLSAVRQWRAVRVPLELLKFSGSNQISVRCQSTDRPVTIYGDTCSASGEICLPSTKYISNGRSLHEIQSLDLRPTEFGKAFRPAGLSLLERRRKADSTDLSSAIGKQSGCYRVYLLLGWNDATAAFGAAAVPLSLPVVFSQATPPAAVSEKVSIPADLARVSRIVVKLTADAATLQKNGILAGQIILNGNAGETYSLPGVPQYFGPENAGSIRVAMPTKAFPAGIVNAQVAVFGRWQGGSALPPMRISVEPIELPDIAGRTTVMF